MNLYYRDESRFGLSAHLGKGLTARGSKPMCTFLFGAHPPVDSDRFELLAPDFSTECFQTFLEHFAERRKGRLNKIQVDNAVSHRAKRLEMSDKVVLPFQPPYSSEPDPSEKIWLRNKKVATNLDFPDLDEPERFLTEQIKALDHQMVKSICALEFYEKAEQLQLIPN